jgi:hypothetical protein
LTQQDTEPVCFVCLRPAAVQSYVGEWFVDCHWCGWYSVRYGVQAGLTVDPEWKAMRPYLAAHIRQTSRRGGLDGRVKVDDDWKAVARSHAQSTLAQKTRRLLEWTASRSRPGHYLKVMIDEVAPWIDACDQDEVLFLLRHLESLRYIELAFSEIPVKDARAGGGLRAAEIRLSVSGWETVSPVAGTAVAGVCFVAMSFDRSLDEAFDLPRVRLRQAALRHAPAQSHQVEERRRSAAAVDAADPRNGLAGGATGPTDEWKLSCALGECVAHLREGRTVDFFTEA